MIKNNRVRLAVATVLSSCAAAAAHAADLGAAGPPGAAGPAAAPAESGGLAEVVVTAERRSETVQNVPITIQAITGDQLAQMRVETLDDVLKYLPNVTFS